MIRLTDFSLTPIWSHT